jgi:hypothetical protein
MNIPIVVLNYGVVTDVLNVDQFLIADFSDIGEGICPICKSENSIDETDVCRACDTDLSKAEYDNLYLNKQIHKVWG